MRLTNIIVGATLLEAAIAAPAVHQHKRDVVTTTVQAKVTVVVGSDGSAINQPPAADAPAGAVTTISTAPAVEATSSAPAQAAVASSEVSSSSTSASRSESASSVSSSNSASSSGSSSDSSVSIGAAGVKGITYSPYTSSGSCKSASEVKADLASLTDYPVLRLYGVDCDQVANVLQAKSPSQKLFLGIFNVGQIQDGVQTIASAVEKYGSWNDIVTVSVGNELVNGGQATPSQVGQYISTAKSALSAAGYTGSVVSVDTFIAVINNPELCKYSDYMAVNAHAYFDKNTVASDAGTWLLQQIQRVYTACGGEKTVVVTESGWPSQGQTYGVAVPSKQNQKAAVESIIKSCGSDTYLFTAFNDLWKADGPYGVEKYFGVLSN
ncbi:hypothetical protein HG536_0A00380 [Torulaspora globosa]|uniref:Glycoside hydrolase family 17 protein n=1 Tax=Torulaspora globosa TaxID=48254 RepID=A0A7G3Z9N5_9SACH|nr:uncharacterized protein HG536_0A00380 [Torulaspora globosa]QLL30221.1 hypothetical protein HG536_0A00380 [Torulaspora globosa]